MLRCLHRAILSTRTPSTLAMQLLTQVLNMLMPGHACFQGSIQWQPPSSSMAGQRRRRITVRTHTRATIAGVFRQVSIHGPQKNTHSIAAGCFSCSKPQCCVGTAAAAAAHLSAHLSWASHQLCPCAACYHGTQTPCSLMSALAQTSPDTSAVACASSNCTGA
jgi:hypothetical protein